ncbi:MAG: endonuclease MutS2, partial [Myxococcota bacterium]
MVPNDIALGAQKRGLIISGPNTGGKTVSLKTLGLCALMARAALPIPAEPGSTIPLFSQLFTDIGDQQSIEQDLSTFSGQIVKIRKFLTHADATTLVLIDEIIVGTDPIQGAALASAILLALLKQQTFLAVTTHYESLKALPYEEERFENASVGFDLQTLAPTYKLYIGTPGASSALEIARQLGLPEAVCVHAETMLDAPSDRFENLVARLEQQYAELYEERASAARARQALERELLALEERKQSVEKLRTRLIEGQEDVLRQEVREAKETLRRSTRALQQQQGSWETLRDHEKQIKAAEQQIRQALYDAKKSSEQAIPLAKIKPKMR